MISNVKKAAVFGSGSMGSGIAAQFANAGVPVMLFDVAGEVGERNATAEAGIARQLRSNGFMRADCAKLVEACNIEDDLSRVAEADWIVEAVVEDIDVKRRLFARIDALRRPRSLVSSNTSTLSLARLIEGQSPSFAENFVITHFFNPPRVMPLVEIVAGSRAAGAALTARLAAEDILGKTVLNCRDTPGFIANRIGCFWIAMTVLEALRVGITIEDADAVASRPFRIPASGAFGLLDLIGLDLVPEVWGSLLRQLPVSDRLWDYDLTAEPLIRRMIETGALGRKTGAGFYRMAKKDGARTREVLDAASFAWRPERKPGAAFAHGPGDLGKLCRSDEPAGRFAWRILSRLTLYSSTVASEIADATADIDLGMRLGYGWAEGPFEIANRVGVAEIVAGLRAEGEVIPRLLAELVARGGSHHKPRSSITTAAPFAERDATDPLRPVAALKRRLVFENAGAALCDTGDGIACLEYKTKMNIYDESVFDAIGAALEEVPKGFRALVIGSDHPRAFSCGADLAFFLGRMKAGDYATLEHFLAYGQERFLDLKYAPFPVIAAAFGLALGGGCETLLHMHEVAAHAELNAGLPESTLGILPGRGGCTQLVVRALQKAEAPKGPVAALRDPFFQILGGRFERLGPPGAGSRVSASDGSDRNEPLESDRPRESASA